MLVKFAFCFSNDVIEMHFSNVEEHFENDLTSNFFSLSFFFLFLQQSVLVNLNAVK